MLTIISAPSDPAPRRKPGNYLVRIGGEGGGMELPLRVTEGGLLDLSQSRPMIYNLALGPLVLRELADFLEDK